jgi:DMSO/TMAO reductase YedYZ molybdopterin-dependent catalytic subunit
MTEKKLGIQGVVQSTPSQYFISRSLGSKEMNWPAVGDFAADGPVDNDRFYIHNRVYPPHVDQTKYRLHVDGDAVGKPLTLSYQQILAMPCVVLDCVLDCGANGASFFPKLPPGQPWPLPRGFAGWQWGAMGAARWEGVLLAHVLTAASANLDKTYLTLTGLDQIPQGNDQVLPYSHVGPMAQYLNAGTLLVYRMNGAMLPIDHGFPLRAVVPGFGANVCVKWLQSIAVTTTEPTPSPLQRNQRLFGPAYPPSGVAPTTQNPKSAFELEMNGTITLKPHQTSVTLYGRAWSAAATITTIEIAIEQEQPDGAWCVVVDWTPVLPLTPPRKHWWVRFSYDWHVTPGSYRLRSRAADDAGNIQPPVADVPWNQHGLHWNGTAAHPITVLPLTNLP